MNENLERMPWIHCGDTYKIILGLSCLVVTGLFLWGLFGKKTDFVRKIIGVELTIFFLLMHIQIAKDCFIELGVLIEMGIDGYFLTQYLRAYIFMTFLISSVSLYKLILYLVLGIKTGIKQKKPNQNMEPMLKTPAD